MAILPIITAPDPVLKQLSRPVEAVDDALRALMDNMLESMYAAPGIGLAAIQVGVPIRAIVMDISNDEAGPEPRHYVNPEVIWHSDELTLYKEGCLSVPEHYAEIERPSEAKIKYLDYDGNQQEIHVTGLLATCIQHEIDHLDGVLFIDHLSGVKRNIIIRKLVKARKLEEVG